MNSDQTTRQPAGTRGRLGPEGDANVLALTVLAHPDLRRIGERAMLPELGMGHPVSLSRTQPEFSRPGAVWDGRSLDDPFLSRRPWLIRPADDGSEGVVLAREGSTIDLEVDGDVVPTRLACSVASLRNGVVLTLAGRVVLLLHLAPARPLIESPAGQMIGASTRLTEVRDAIARVANLDVPVLLRGASGTGKELAARALHDQGRRGSRPFIAVNLGALSPTLAASELFGHAKGAFTGAVTAREGYFRAAEGGTLFLDEVGEAPDEIQAMLLRALETREIVPVGSRTPRKVDVRLVAATDADLERRARRGDFKAPLLHRLSAYEILLPTLSERREDLGRLFVHFARSVLRDLDDEDRLLRFDPDAPPWLPAPMMVRLAAYPWPGNVRQLKNVVRQVVIDSQGTTQLRMSARLEARLESDVSGTIDSALLGQADGREPDAEPREGRRRATARRPADIDADELSAAMREARFEPAAAARLLGISRPSVYNLIRQHPILRTADDVPRTELETALEAATGRVEEAAIQLEVSARALARRIARKPELLESD